MGIRVGIIGAGWYGCHLALSLKSLGFDVTIFERNQRILHEASGNNQFRLHLGFHYARHHGTRIQSRDGFMRFMERYPNLSRAVEDNIYAVPTEESLIDFATYKLIMTASGLDFKEIDMAGHDIVGVNGMILTGERVLLTEKARQYFMSRLVDNLILGEAVDTVEPADETIKLNGMTFDFAIDCTWGHRGGLPIKFFYEPTVLLYYEAPLGTPALTLVDGPLASLYPTEDRSIFTLSSVPHTPVGKFLSIEDAYRARNAVDTACIESKRRLMEDQISQYLPDFGDRMKFIGPQISMKTKPVGNFDDRSCYVFRDGRMFNVMSGKIDTIFFALERILSFIETDVAGDDDDPPSLLRLELMAQQV